jgi:predicted RNase H-like nuclease (RuvC/YqgF family)
MCRDEYTRELRQQTKEEREAVDMKRDRDIKKLKKTITLQANAIETMESQLQSIQRKMADMEIGLGDLTPPRKKIGFKIGKK